MDVREKLVELIDSARYWGGNTSEEIADSLIAHGVTVQEWIPVSERLPDIGIPVLITYLGFIDNKLHNDGVAAVDKFGSWGWWDGDCADETVCVRVTHWMPLPKPPKGD